MESTSNNNIHNQPESPGESHHAHQSHDKHAGHNDPDFAGGLLV